MKTPFSGLSLIAHLVIISVGKIIDISQKKKPIITERIVKKNSEMSLHTWFNYSVSSIIFVTLLSVFLIFFGIAMKTSIREGMHEWRRERARNAWIAMESYSKESITAFKKLVIFSSIDVECMWSRCRVFTNNYPSL